MRQYTMGMEIVELDKMRSRTQERKKQDKRRNSRLSPGSGIELILIELPIKPLIRNFSEIVK